jgi:hypothetical protein
VFAHNFRKREKDKSGVGLARVARLVIDELGLPLLLHVLERPRGENRLRLGLQEDTGANQQRVAAQRYRLE